MRITENQYGLSTYVLCDVIAGSDCVGLPLYRDSLSIGILKRKRILKWLAGVLGGSSNGLRLHALPASAPASGALLSFCVLNTRKNHVQEYSFH
jgi:hypothetical protein